MSHAYCSSLDAFSCTLLSFDPKLWEDPLVGVMAFIYEVRVKVGTWKRHINSSKLRTSSLILSLNMSNQSIKNLHCATYHLTACICELVCLWETRYHWVTPSSADVRDLVSSWQQFRHIVQPLLPGIMSSAPAAIDYNPALLPHSQSRNNLTWNLEKRVSVCCNSAGLSYPA